MCFSERCLAWFSRLLCERPKRREASTIQVNAHIIRFLGEMWTQWGGGVTSHKGEIWGSDGSDCHLGRVTVESGRFIPTWRNTCCLCHQRGAHTVYITSFPRAAYWATWLMKQEFFRNVGVLVTDYTALHFGRQFSSSCKGASGCWATVCTYRVWSWPTTHLHLVPKLRMRGAIPPLCHIYAYVAWTGTALPSTFGPTPACIGAWQITRLSTKILHHGGGLRYGTVTTWRAEARDRQEPRSPCPGLSGTWLACAVVRSSWWCFA
jgi:hypothetical protein